jgi:hypothetical protein
MEEMADRAIVNGSSVGRLHTDFPMDTMSNRFERRLRANLEKVRKVSEELNGVMGYSSEVREKMVEVKGLVEGVRGEMKGARVEMVEECVRQIEASEGVLARMGVRFSGAVLTSAATPAGASAAPADPAGGGFWDVEQAMSRPRADIDGMFSPTSRPLPPFQVAAEVYDAHVNRNSPSATRVSGVRCRSGRSVSVVSMASAQETSKIDRRAREEEKLIDEAEEDLVEQETILAAKAKSRGARARRELEDRRFEVAATRRESLAQLEEEMANGVRSACGLDVESVSSWVDGTCQRGGPGGATAVGAAVPVAGTDDVVVDLSVLDIPLPPPLPSCHTIPYCAAFPPPPPPPSHLHQYQTNATPHHTTPHHTTPHHTTPHYTAPCRCHINAIPMPHQCHTNDTPMSH